MSILKADEQIPVKIKIISFGCIYFWLLTTAAYKSGVSNIYFEQASYYREPV